MNGTAELVRGHSAVLETFGLPLFAWQAGSKSRFVRITRDSISGREFDLVDNAWWSVSQVRAAPAE